MSTLTTDDLRGLVASVGAMSEAIDDADRIERLRQFEELKSAICAAQAVVAAEFDCSQRSHQAASGSPVERQGRGVANQVGLALRVSPWRAQRWLGWAKILTSELPCTFAQLRAGKTTEWRTMLVARETAVLTREQRGAVDRELAPRLEQWGDRRVDAETRRAAYRLDPVAAVERARNAEADRGVGLRAAPDTMCRLTALLPVAQGVAAYAALRAEADRSIGVGDGRTRRQVMADTLITRLTGQSTASATPVEITLVMDGQAFRAGGGNDPAWLDGYGPVPAGWARELAYGLDSTAPRWLRRLYTRSGKMVGLDSRRRLFTPGQQRFLRRRDQNCRTPWCDAPIRHADHVTPYEHGGPTHVDNGGGLCEACNYAKQAAGWHARHGPEGVITIRTPTGHTYLSRAPDLTAAPTSSPLERHAWQLMTAA